MSTEHINETLRKACRDGKLQEVRRLLTAGADVNADINYTRPLVIAAKQGHIEVVQFLLDNGADINANNEDDGWTAIHHASYSGRTPIFDLLAFRGANVEQKTDHGFHRSFMPLTVAAQSGKVQIIETLVVFGADIDAATGAAQTPLMFAVHYMEIGAVRLLLTLNADITKIDRDSNTAVQLAKTDAMEDVLLDQGKKSDEERKQSAKEAMARIQHKVSIRLMRCAQPEIIGICLAFASFDLPPYVLLWIVDFLPNYNLLSHHKKIELITSVRNSIWKLKQYRIDSIEMDSAINSENNDDDNKQKKCIIV